MRLKILHRLNFSVVEIRLRMVLRDTVDAMTGTESSREPKEARSTTATMAPAAHRIRDVGEKADFLLFTAILD